MDHTPEDPHITINIGGVGYTPDFLRSQIEELKKELNDPNAPFGYYLLLYLIFFEVYSILLSYKFIVLFSISILNYIF